MMNQDPDTNLQDSRPPEAVPGESVPERRAQAPAPSRAWMWDVLAVIAAVMVILVLYQPVRVEGTSMLPMLEDQDRLFINKFAYHIGEVHRGDVVVFHNPRDTSESYIKRVIAIPGDTVKIDHGVVWVDGHDLKEPYVPPRYQDDRSQPELTLGPGEYFVLGDHRSVSKDSRDFGTVQRDLIYGRAAFVYWPVDQAGVVH